MNTKKKYISLLFLFLHILSFSQNNWQIGATTLNVGSSSAPLTFKAPKSFNVAYLSRIGGVSFEKILDGDENISLNFLPNNESGEKAIIKINGELMHIALPDWQLIPIAKFADTEHDAAVSLFGPETDSSKFDIVYHPAFKNTLLGLRLLQADMMLMDVKNNFRLPKYNGDFVMLGEGENNNYSVYQSDLNKLENFMVNYQGEYQSWIYTDKENEIKINSNNEIEFDQPYYYFWYQSFVVTQDAQQKIDSLNQSYEHLTVNGEPMYPVTISQVMLSASIYEILDFQDFLNDDFLELDEYYNYQLELCDILLELEVEAEISYDMTLEFLDYYQTLKRVNPMVYEAAENTMMYSAIFRYIKKQNPYMWQKFMTQINKVSIYPKVRTPTELPKY